MLLTPLIISMDFPPYFFSICFVNLIIFPDGSSSQENEPKDSVKFASTAGFNFANSCGID